jgi:hypothetical protein
MESAIQSKGGGAWNQTPTLTLILIVTFLVRPLETPAEESDSLQASILKSSL